MKIFCSIAIATVVIGLLTGCGPEFAPMDSPPPTVTPSPSFTGYKGAPELWIPAVPEKKWRKPGDLCKIITPEMAASKEVLGYPGAFRAYAGTSGIPVRKLLDACSYVSVTEPKMRVIVTVREDAAVSVWEGFLQHTAQEHPDRRREIKSYTIKGLNGEEKKGVWRAMSTPSLQGLVWAADSRLGVVRYDSSGRMQMKPDRLVILAKMALDATTTK